MQWSDRRMGKMHPMLYILGLNYDYADEKLAMNGKWMAENVFKRCGEGNRASFFLDERIGMMVWDMTPKKGSFSYAPSETKIVFMDGSVLWTDDRGTINEWKSPNVIS